MPAFAFDGLNSAQINDLAQLAQAPYSGRNPPADWTTLTGQQIGGGAYTGETFTNGPAAAEVYRKGSEITVSFRGSDGLGDVLDWPTLLFGNSYIENFDALLNAVRTYASAQGFTQIFVTGHSLGAAAANILRNVADSRYGGAFSDASFVAFASPKISGNSDILNIGMDNDWIFKRIEYINIFNPDDFSSTTDNIFWFNDGAYDNALSGSNPRSLNEALGQATNYPHSSSNHIDAVARITGSEFYDQMSRDSIILVDSTNNPLIPVGPNTTDATGPIFYLGQDIDDVFIGSAFGDFMESLAGDDYVDAAEGNDRVSLGLGDDGVQGGGGDDTLDGGAGQDVAYYADVGAGISVDLNQRGVNVTGGGGNDALTEIEDIVGSLQSDTLIGDDENNLLVALGGNDSVVGNGGDDTLLSGVGIDTLDGGIGNDVLESNGSASLLTGGSGEDTFIFSAGGTHRITDFEDLSDFIMIDRETPFTFGQLDIAQQGADARVVAGTEVTLTLVFENTQASLLDQNDFILV